MGRCFFGRLSYELCLNPWLFSYLVVVNLEFCRRVLETPKMSPLTEPTLKLSAFRARFPCPVFLRINRIGYRWRWHNYDADYRSAMLDLAHVALRSSRRWSLFI